MSQYITQSEMQYMLSFNIVKFRDILLHNRRYTYHKSVIDAIAKHTHDIRNSIIKINDRCSACHDIYYMIYEHHHKITFYSAQYWSKNLKFNKDNSRVYNVNTITVFIISDYESYIKLDNHDGKYYMFGAPIVNLTIHRQPWRTTYPRTYYTFEYDFSTYCDSILYILRAKKHKRSLFSWLPTELIKTILILMSYLL